MGLSQFEERVPLNTIRAIVAADGLNDVSFLSGIQTVIRLDTLRCTNTDVIDHHVRLVLAPFAWGSGDLGVVLVPAGAGYTTGPPIDMLAILDDRNPQLTLDQQDVLTFAVQEAVTSIFRVQLVGRGGLI